MALETLEELKKAKETRVNQRGRSEDVLRESEHRQQIRQPFDYVKDFAFHVRAVEVCSRIVCEVLG